MERFTSCSYDSLHIAKFHSRKAIALATAFAIASFDVVIMLCLCSADNGMNEESALVFRNTAKTKKSLGCQARCKATRAILFYINAMTTVVLPLQSRNNVMY